MDPNRAVTIQEFYVQRDREDQYERQWGYSNPIAAAYWRMRDEMVLEGVLGRIDPLSRPLRVLEVGVGHGYELAKLSLLGIAQSNLAGVDLAFHRLVRARSTFPAITFSQQDATSLAFANDSFDIVCQFTCVMHATSKEMQKRICMEMARVLKPGGFVIWWDAAPVQWKLIVCYRVCKLLRMENMRQSLKDILKSLYELMIPSRRKRAAAEWEAAHVLPVGREELPGFFPSLRVHATKAGLDYPIWALLWRRSRSLAGLLWRTGWLSRHCFAIIEKS